LIGKNGKGNATNYRSKGFCGKYKNPVWSINMVMQAISFSKFDFETVSFFEHKDKKGTDFSFSANLSTENLSLP